jgi:hypothetical protein
MNWNDKVALITGASAGIGLAAAQAFVARGARVALVARSEETLQRAARELGAERAVAFAADVTDRAVLAALPGRIVERFGRLDIVVNNAGANYRGSVPERSAEELATILETNLLGPVLLTHAALPYLKSGSVIVNVASLAGKVPLPHEATYSASKAGLRAFSRAIDVELKSAGIRVCSVCPGPVDTGFLGDLSTVPDIVFSQPMSTAQQVADAIVRAVESDAREVDVPAMSGKLATLGYLSPKLMAALRPVLELQGSRKKRSLMAGRQKR